MPLAIKANYKYIIATLELRTGSWNREDGREGGRGSSSRHSTNQTNICFVFRSFRFIDNWIALSVQHTYAWFALPHTHTQWQAMHTCWCRAWIGRRRRILNAYAKLISEIIFSHVFSGFHLNEFATAGESLSVCVCVSVFFACVCVLLLKIASINKYLQ